MLQRRQVLGWGAAAVAMPSALSTSVLAAAPKAARRAPFDFANADGAAMAQALRAGQVTSLQLVTEAIRRLQAVNPRLNAAHFLYPDEALAQAQAVPTQRPGALAGLPTLVKDIVEEKGRAYTSGARAYAARVGGRDSPAVVALRASGLVSLGRSCSPEFGLLPTTEPLLTGATLNPWNPAYSAGGSSGGAGALVAAGVVPFAHATDGGGSIRIPASVNGLVGLKPSRGRMAGEEARRGVGALSVGGCVSRTVRDTAAWLAANESRSGPHKPVGLVSGPARRGLRIGLRAEGARGLPHADVIAVFDGAETLLARLGHKPVAAPTPYDSPAVMAAFESLWSAGAAADVREASAWLGREAGADDLEPATFAFAALAQRRGKGAVANAITTLELMARQYVAQFDAFDILMTPVLGTPPARIGELAPTVPFQTLIERLWRYVAYTPVENAVGAPAISLPLGMSSEGLPIGLQFTAPPGGERRLLELAFALEAARPWAGLRPSIWSR